MILPIYDFEHHTIQDPIHGAITFGSIEKAIIDHPLFQRLHGLRQNSLLYLIFPAANHTRFDHSLGVMYLADKCFDRILINQRHICEAEHSRETFQEPYRVGEATIEESIRILNHDHYFKLVLRVSALFHDIGHGPLSHLFDNFFPSWEKMQSFFRDPELTHLELRASTIPQDRKGEIIRHEVLSCLIATRVLLDCSSELGHHKLNHDRMIKDVCSIIDDDIQASEQLELPHYKTQYLLHDILSSDIDVDRMDYLLRDSQMCGVNYGLYDPHRILKSMCAYGRTDRGELRVAIRHSGLDALEDFMLSRYQMHSQIYGHKTNCACSAMLEKISDRLKESNWTWYKECESASNLLEVFLGLNDQSFILILLKEDVDCGQGKVKEIAKKLFVDRRLFKRAWEQRYADRGNGGSQNEPKTEWEKIQNLLGDAKIRFAKHCFENKGPKFNYEEDSTIKILKKDPKSRIYKVCEIRDLSTVAKVLPRVEYTYRIYCKAPYLEQVRELLPG